MIDDAILTVLKDGIDSSQIYEEPAKGGNRVLTGRRGCLDRDDKRST